jgi:hypothetical protein
MAKIIVKLLNGEEKSGSVLSLNVNLPSLYLQVEDDAGKPQVLTIYMNSIKAIFFPKSEEKGGLPIRTETIDQSLFAGPAAFKVVVEFNDGEVLNGTTLKYNPNDKGFFLLPINPADRSERIYVNTSAVKNVDIRKLLGKILIDNKKIDTEQLENALRYQKEKREKRIGAILREAAIINEEQLQESLSKQKEKNRMLGEILLEARYITPEQLEFALEVQRENKKKKLGQIFVELKYLTPNDICIALATQFHFPWMDLSHVKISVETATILPVETVRKLEVIPVEKKPENILVVATSTPQNPTIASELSKSTPMRVELVIAYEGYIEAAIKHYFPEVE